MKDTLHFKLLEIAENEDNLFKEIKDEEILELMDIYDLTNEEAVVFSFILKFHLERRSIDLEKFESEFIKKGDRNYIRILKNLREMEKKGVININKDTHSRYPRRRGYDPINPSIEIDEAVIEKVVLGEDFLDTIDFKDTYSILEGANDLILRRVDDKISEKKYFSSLDTFVDKMDKQLPITMLVTKYSTFEKSMILRACLSKLKGDRPDSVNDFVEGVIDSIKYVSEKVADIQEKKFNVLKDKVLELVTISKKMGYMTDIRFVLSDKYYEKIFETKQKNKNRELRTHYTEHIEYKKLNKELYFDDDLRKKVNVLSTALENKQFKVISKRLKGKGFAPGIVSLLYGFPGTGKTATVHQIAKLTKRDILQVDISNINDKFVGESEKRLKEVFNEYRKAVKTLSKAPILLFNESDALIGKRIDVKTSVDQMRNNMQNILLEELEKFEGIFFATTNLTENMDDAFNRRFLYKVEFTKPSAGIRKRIWESKMEDISSDWIDKLSNYDLTGGQIDNITRKYMIDEMLMLNSGFEDLEKMCEEESNFKKEKMFTIGFR